MKYTREIEIDFGEPFYGSAEFEVNFWYEQGEPEIIRADPNDCQQGSGDEVEILSIKYKGECANFLLKIAKFEDELKDICIEVLGDE